MHGRRATGSIWTDKVAERMSAIGVSLDGRTDTVAKHSAVPDFAAGWVSDRDVIRQIFESVDVVVRAVRPRLDDTEKSDLVTQDLLIGVVGSFAARYAAAHPGGGAAVSAGRGPRG